MSDELNNALQSAVSAVLEDLAFMLPSRDLSESQLEAPFQMASAAEFWGPISGKLVVAVYGNLVKVIAANMLGDTDSPSEDQQTDALKELANVICGNMLPLLLGEEAVYQIDAPSVLEVSNWPGASFMPPAAQIQVGMDAGRADIQLFLYRNVPREPGE